MWWLAPAIVVMLAFAAICIPFGVWVLATSKWPSWMRGALKWPVGDNLSPRVVMLQGWTYVLEGAACIVLLFLLIFLPALLADNTTTAGWVVGLLLAVGACLSLGGMVPYTRSVIESRR